MNGGPGNPYLAPHDHGDSRVLHRPTGVTFARYKAVAFLAAVAMVAYISRNSISVPADTIQTALRLSDTRMGWVMSAFFWTYAFSQIPAGWFGQQWGTRKALTLYAIVWSAASLLAGVAVGFWSLIAARMLFGVAQAGVFPCCANTISKWLPNSQRGKASGLLGSFMSLGGAISLALTGLLLAGTDIGGLQIPAMSWRLIFIVLAVPGVIWAVWFFWWFRDRPEEHASVGEMELATIHTDRIEPVASTAASSAEPSSTPWEIILTSRSMWLINGQQFFRAAGYVFYVTWFPKYLQEFHSVTIAKSGVLASLPLLAHIAGASMGGIVVDWIWVRTGSRRLSRNGTAITAMVVCSLLTIAATQATALWFAMVLIVIAVFSAAFGGSCGYTVTIDKGGDHIGPVFGMMNMAGNLGAASLPIVVGMLFDEKLYNASLMLVAGIYGLAAVCWLFLNPEGTLFDESPVAPTG